jgi:hypothetical protein
MEKFLQAAAIAWNPIGSVRKRMEDGTLTVGAVLASYIAIIVACNLFAVGAQKFFYETLLNAVGSQMPNLPALSSEYVQRVLAAIGILLPAGAVALLPDRTFSPVGRSAVVATILVVAAAWAFYGAAISVPMYVFLGMMAAVDPRSAYTAFLVIGTLVTLGIFCLALFFWFRTMLSVLRLNGAQVASITFVAVIAEALLAAFFYYFVMGSLSHM